MRICIIGGTGRTGQFFNKIFLEDGFKTELMGRKNYHRLKSIVNRSDLIIISIPVDKVKKILDDLSNIVKKEHAVIDFSSVMLNEEILRKLKCGSAFVHPLFAPTIKNLGQANFIAVPINKNKNLDWFFHYLKSKGAFVKKSNVKAHEKLMAYIQALAHFNGILLAKTIADSDLSAEEIERFSTIFFRLQLDAISRIFSQTPEMYANIQFHNKMFLKLLDQYEENLKELKKVVAEKNHQAYEELFKKVTKKLSKAIAHSFQESQEIIEALPISKIKVGTLGPAGSFSEVAANNFDANARKIFFDSTLDVIKAVVDGLVDFGVVPIENSIGGSVAEVIDAIYIHSLTIEKAVIVPISHCCAALSRKIKPEILLSHPQAFMQCSEYIEKHYPNAKKINTLSTSAAFKKIAEDYLTNAIAIGPKLAAEKYGLKIIAEKIENKVNNKTKFAVVSKEKKINPKGKVTSLVLDPKTDRPGILFDMLKPFKEQNINLSKIESRPSKQKLGIYVFHIDIDANILDEKVQKAVKKMEKLGKVTFLGSYNKVVVK